MNEIPNKPEEKQDSEALGSGKTAPETESGSYARDDVQKGVFQDADDLETFDGAGAFQPDAFQGDAFDTGDEKDSE